jgi:hypothetical protein
MRKKARVGAASTAMVPRRKAVARELLLPEDQRTRVASPPLTASKPTAHRGAAIPSPTKADPAATPSASCKPDARGDASSLLRHRWFDSHDTVNKAKPQINHAARRHLLTGAPVRITTSRQGFSTTSSGPKSAESLRAPGSVGSPSDTTLHLGEGSATSAKGNRSVRKLKPAARCQVSPPISKDRTETSVVAPKLAR